MFFFFFLAMVADGNVILSGDCNKNTGTLRVTELPLEASCCIHSLGHSNLKIPHCHGRRVQVETN